MGTCPECGQRNIKAEEEVISPGEIIVSQWVCPECDVILDVTASE